jgi:phosphoserine aminotransferase
MRGIRENILAGAKARPAHRIHNFFPGPGALPLEVIEQVKNELDDYQGMGFSILEMSHRHDAYAEIHAEATQLVRRLLGVPENYHVMWLQGGASLQFAMLPMNLLGGNRSADYVMTGVWSERAFKEANIVGQARIVGSSQADGYTHIPRDLDVDPDAAYLHVTSNNTIMGTQFFDYPDAGEVPLVGDMSSDIFSRVIDVNQFGMIFAGAHKNLGPSGITMAILREDMLDQCNRNLPTLLQYGTHVEHDSMFNTPVTFTIFFVRNVLQWIERQGGLPAIEVLNNRKAAMFYDCVDSSGGFYRCPIGPADRSLMNAVFNLSSPELEDRFCAAATEQGMVGLKNLPQRGGCRVSLYNAVEVESVEALVQFMGEFQRLHG